MGVRLFHRTARAISLIEEGRRFFEDVRPLLAGIEDAASLAVGAASLVRGRLRINSTLDLASSFSRRICRSCSRSIPIWRLSSLFGSVRATLWATGLTWPSVSASRNRRR